VDSSGLICLKRLKAGQSRARGADKNIKGTNKLGEKEKKTTGGEALISEGPQGQFEKFAG